MDVLDTQDAEPKRVSLAIRAVGKLAAAIVKFSGKESLKEAFHRLEPFGTSTRLCHSSFGTFASEFLRICNMVLGRFQQMWILFKSRGYFIFLNCIYHISKVITVLGIMHLANVRSAADSSSSPYSGCSHVRALQGWRWS